VACRSGPLALKLIDFSVLGASLAFLILAAPAAAQDTGTVSGTVIDNTNQVVPAQVNANFGTAIGIGSPTRSPRTLQMSLRFNF
jgi:hypothetical protein